MRNRMGFALCVLVSGLVFGYLWSIRSVGAAPQGPDDSKPAAAGGSFDGARSGSLRPEWKLGAPVTSGNLTVFPVIASAWSGANEFITLDEGLKSGKVTITELGVGRRPGGRGPREGAEVNTLSLTNRTGRTLILLAGEMLIGGKQDRIVDRDQLVPPDDLPIALGVFCVEHGRWQGASTSFGQSQRASGSQAPGARNFLAAGSGGGAGGGQIATPAVREKAEAGKDQSGVWSKVAETTEVLNVTSNTGALTRAYQDGSLARKSHVYESQIRYRIGGKNVVGVVVAVSGQLVAADIFASPSLFGRYWPKLLKSYALEALGSSNTAAGRIDQLDAQAFLSRVEGNSSTDSKSGVYRLTEHKSGTHSSFELECIAAAQPVLVHFNRIASQ